MTTKRSAALSAIGSGTSAQPSEPLKVEATRVPTPVPAAPLSETVVHLRQPKAKPTKTVGKVMLYLPPKVAKKFKEMAFHEDCKAHDLYLQALEGFLRDKGHAAVAELLDKREKN